MPSSVSDRRVLHMVSASPYASDALSRALALMAGADVLLLVGDATLAALAAGAEHVPGLPRQRCFVLAADLAARGFAELPLREGVLAIDDSQWVALTVGCDTCVSWSR